jgi:hypothetical protein
MLRKLGAGAFLPTVKNPPIFLLVPYRGCAISGWNDVRTYDMSVQMMLEARRCCQAISRRMVLQIVARLPWFCMRHELLVADLAACSKPLQYSQLRTSHAGSEHDLRH